MTEMPFGSEAATAQGRHVGRPAKYRVDPMAARNLLAAGVRCAEWPGSSGCTPAPSGAPSCVKVQTEVRLFAGRMSQRIACRDQKFWAGQAFKLTHYPAMCPAGP